MKKIKWIQVLMMILYPKKIFGFIFIIYCFYTEIKLINKNSYYKIIFMNEIKLIFMQWFLFLKSFHQKGITLIPET